MANRLIFDNHLDDEVSTGLDKAIQENGGEQFDGFPIRSMFSPVDVKLYEIPKFGEITTYVARGGNAKFQGKRGILVYTAMIQFAGFDESSEGFQALYDKLEGVLKQYDLGF